MRHVPTCDCERCTLLRKVERYEKVLREIVDEDDGYGAGLRWAAGRAREALEKGGKS